MKGLGSKVDDYHFVLGESTGCIKPQIFDIGFVILGVINGWVLARKGYVEVFVYHSCTREYKKASYWNTAREMDSDVGGRRRRKSCYLCTKRMPKKVIETCHLLGMGT